MPDRSLLGVIMPTMSLLKTIRSRALRLELSTTQRDASDAMYPLVLKRGTLVVTDANGEEYMHDGQAIINLDRSLSIITEGEIVAYFPEGCFHVWNVD